MTEKYERIIELICELNRNCVIKEEIFARSFNLSPTEVRLLKLFVFADQYFIKDLREELNLTPGRISHILKSLERKKVIKRSIDSEDNRRTIVKLTPGAIPFIKNLHENYQQLHEKLLREFKGEELKNIEQVLEVLVDVFKGWVRNQ